VVVVEIALSVKTVFLDVLILVARVEMYLVMNRF